MTGFSKPFNTQDKNYKNPLNKRPQNLKNAENRIEENKKIIEGQFNFYVGRREKKYKEHIEKNKEEILRDHQKTKPIQKINERQQEFNKFHNIGISNIILENSYADINHKYIKNLDEKLQKITWNDLENLKMNMD